MVSNRETFWHNGTFAFVGHSARRPFPKLSYGGLKWEGRKVFAVDPSVDKLDNGDRAYNSLAELPERVDAVVIEVPREETLGWVQQAADAGIEHVWIHQGCETPAALRLAEDRGINLRYGSCAVMYVKPGFSYHAIHRGIEKLLGRY